MCELFGVCSAEKLQVNTLLKTFFSHGKKNPDGWGMAFFYGSSVSNEKQPESSLKSVYLKQRLRSKIYVTNFFAHIRAATRGDMIYDNCHPFSEIDAAGRTWTLIHNGTIFEFDPLSKYVKRQEGTTDSERILLYIVDRISEAEKREGRDLEKEERFRILDGIVCDMSVENKLNLLLYDGEVMYVHTNFKDSLYYSRRGQGIVFSTTMLDHLEEFTWEPVPFTQLLAYQDGRLIETGTKHGHEFVYTEEKLRLLYLDYSSL